MIEIEKIQKMMKSEYGFRLDSTYILNYNMYKSIIYCLKQSGIDVIKISEYAKRSKEKAYGKTATILIKSLWKTSIHPLKIELRMHGNRLRCYELDIVGVATGLGSIGKISIVPRYFIEIIKEPIATTTDLFVLRPRENNKEIAYYIVALLNTNIGSIITNMLTYGSTGQLHLDIKWLENIEIPLIDFKINVIEKMKKAIENYEAKAWQAYFKVMKIIEKYLGTFRIRLTNISTFREFTQYGRLDSKFYIYLNALRNIQSVKIISAKELFDIKLGTAPRSRKYKLIRKGEPYISYDSIDDTGLIDENLFYRIPILSKTKARARKYGILITSVAHSIEGIGKVGIVFPYDNILCMTGLAILNPSKQKMSELSRKIEYLKEKTLEEIMLYTFLVLKSRPMKKVIQSLTYGLTAQISKKDLENLPIPIIKDLLDSEAITLIREFLELMIKADQLKKQVIISLENELLKIINQN